MTLRYDIYVINKWEEDDKYVNSRRIHLGKYFYCNNDNSLLTRQYRYQKSGGLPDSPYVRSYGSPPLYRQPWSSLRSSMVDNSWWETARSDIFIIINKTKPLDLIIYIITLNKTSAALRPHKYMNGSIGALKIMCSLWVQQIHFYLAAKIF